MAEIEVIQQTTQQQDQQQTTTTTTGLSGNSFTSPIDGKTYTIKDGLDQAVVYDQETRRFRVANPGEQGATRREGESYIIDDSTGQIVSLVRTYNEPNAIKDTLTKKFGVDTTRNADGSLTEEEQIRRFGYTGDSSTIGNYQRAILEAQDQVIGRINGTGSYVIADVVRDGTVLSQNIYDPNGGFIKSVNPRLKEQGANTDTLGTLIAIQQQRHGTASERIEGLTFDYNLTKNRTLASFANTGLNVDPSKVNSAVQNTAREIMSIKAGTTREFMRDILDPVDSLYRRQNGNVSLRNYDALISADNTLQAAAASSAQILTSIRPFGVETFTEGQFAEYYDAGGIQTSNGFTIKYVRDENYTERGGYAGRLTLISPFGNQLSGLDHVGGPWGSPLDMIRAQYTYGFGSIDSGELSNYLSDKLFRSDPKENAALIRNLVNAADYMTNANLSIDYSQPNLTIDFGWAPGGYLRGQWDQSAKERAAANQAAVDAERAARTSGQVTQAPPSATMPTGTTQAVTQTTYQQQQQPVDPATSGTPTGITTPTGIQTPTGITGDTTQTYPQAPVTGTFDVPTDTGGTSAVPSTVTLTPGVAGYNQQQLTQTMPGVSTFGNNIGVQTVTYKNQFGQSIPVTVQNGQPITYVPPGYTRAAKGGLMRSGYAGGGSARAPSEDKMLEAKYRIASMNGYNGPKTNQALDAFASASPAMKAKFNAIGAALAKGGYLRKNYSGGGLEDGSTFSLAPGTTVGQTTTDPDSGTSYKWNGSVWEVQSSATSTTTEQDPFQQSMSSLVTQTMQPIQAPVSYIQPTELDFIPSTAGQIVGQAPYADAATVMSTEQAMMPVMTPASFMQASTATPQVQQATEQMQPAQGQVSQQAQVQAAQQGTTSVSGMQAAQGTAILMDNPVQRQIQSGELITGAADAQTAAAFTEQVQAATATPSKQATVQGQLEGLMQQFEGGNRPAWAAASMRNATAILAARGLGASSLAGQAVIQAAMEAALPIAQMDAQIQSQFEAQNLSNRQQRAMLAAQQRAEFLGMEFTQEFQARVQNSARIGDIANMNFTAEQSIALENSRAANTVNLNNLSNRQAMVMAEAAALSQLDMQNLNNRQQAAVQNAQNFLQMDMTNLSNQQQAAMFKAQSTVQALFTDQAAKNAAAQFNASSENQTNQFFASLSSQTSQFNAAQQNAMDQFNVNSVNALREFNASLQQQRDMFNAQNGLVIAQANAQWRQNIATLNTASQNQSNMDFAKTINALTSTNLDQIWQRERDLMSFAFTSSENSMDRALKIILGDKQLESVRMQLDAQEKAAKGSLFTRFLFGSGGAGGGGLLGKLVPGLGF